MPPFRAHEVYQIDQGSKPYSRRSPSSSVSRSSSPQSTNVNNGSQLNFFKPEDNDVPIMDMMQNTSSEDGDDDYDNAKRHAHQESEKKRRNKINDAIDRAREVLPGHANNKSAPKASVIGDCVRYIQELENALTNSGYALPYFTPEHKISLVEPAPVFQNESKGISSSRCPSCNRPVESQNPEFNINTFVQFSAEPSFLRSGASSPMMPFLSLPV